MRVYVARRVVTALGLTVLVSVLARSLIHFLPGDPVSLILGSETAVDPQVLQTVRAQLGLDRPVYAQVASWIVGLFRLDLGQALSTGQPVIEVIAETLPRSLYIVIGGTLVGTLLGVPLGVIAALHRNRPLDWITSGIAALGISTPVFVVGTLLVLFFGVELRWFPASGYVGFSEDPSAFFRRLTLPVTTLGFGMLALVGRMTRSTMLEVLGQDYVRTARSKGLDRRRVVYRHALANALVPVVALVGVELGTLLGRTVLVEYIFNWPGMATMLLRAVRFRDYAVAQGIVLVISLIFIFVNLLADLLYALLDPRIRYE
ncbi:MAG: ABC transporter permease [Armatimonadota bacterium]|nr:ABC transporter permease [Armatimonadota bacterium]